MSCLQINPQADGVRREEGIEEKEERKEGKENQTQTFSAQEAV